MNMEILVIFGIQYDPTNTRVTKYEYIRFKSEVHTIRP